MAGDGQVVVTMNRKALAILEDSVLDAVEQIFQADILGDAQELSPRDTGTNARSLDVAVQRLPEGGGVLGEIFSQSGYGGYLETGHLVRGDSGNMVEGRPYMYPAVINNLPALAKAVKKNLQIKGGRV